MTSTVTAVCDVNQYAKCTSCEAEIPKPATVDSSGRAKCGNEDCIRQPELVYFTIVWTVDGTNPTYPPQDSLYICGNTHCAHPRPYLGGVDSDEISGYCVSCGEENDILMKDGTAVEVDDDAATVTS